jgi:ATP-binding cassette, subfamily B (MDR/TAP), member 1
VYANDVLRQIRDLQLSTSVPLGEGAQCIVMGATALMLAFYYSWDLTLVTISTIPIIYLIMYILSGVLSRRAHEHTENLQNALKHATTAVGNIEVVKFYNGERFQLDKFVSSITKAGELYKRQAHLRSAQIGLMQFTSMSVFFQGFWYASYSVMTGKNNTGQVVTTFWAALMAIQAITEFLPQFINVQKGKVAGACLRAVMKNIHKNGLQTATIPMRVSGDIEFKQVW